VALFKHRNQQAPAPIPSLEDRLATWEAEDESLAALVEQARSFRGFTSSELTERSPVALKAGERAYLILDGATLVEPRSSGGHWVGGYQGVSVHIPGTRSARYRIGGSRGHYVRDEEKPTVLDVGGVVITDKRVVFAGSKQAREWVWSKVIGLLHEDVGAWTAIPVSNRQKTSGVGYDEAHLAEVRFRLDLAFAVANGTSQELVDELEADRTEHASHRPGNALPPPAV
jgi:hypothetical protein